MFKIIRPQMHEGERKHVCAKLEWEGGLEYLTTGTDFGEISDQHFHELRLRYIAAAKELEAYIRYDDYLNNEAPMAEG
jgi:hypothetical protein